MFIRWPISRKVCQWKRIIFHSPKANIIHPNRPIEPRRQRDANRFNILGEEHIFTLHLTPFVRFRRFAARKQRKVCIEQNFAVCVIHIQSWPELVMGILFNPKIQTVLFIRLNLDFLFFETLIYTLTLCCVLML